MRCVVRGPMAMASPERPQTNDGVVQLLPWDALYEILLRVPSRPLCRFRAVCRSWRSLLSDPPFVAAHAVHHRDDPPLIAVCGGGGEAVEIRLLDMSDGGSVVKRVVDAGAGPPWFFLLRQVRPHLDRVLIHRRILGDDRRRSLRVLDPATGAVVSLVLPACYDDSTCSSCVLGRAVSSAGGEGEYKVLCLGAYNGTRHCRVLTVDGGGHGAWRAAPMPPVAIGILHHRRTMVAGGVVYHLLENDDYSNDWGPIAAFDLEVEQWRPTLLQGPPAAAGGPRGGRRLLAEVNRRLAAVCSTVSTLDMWLLMGGSAAGEPPQAVWCKRHRVVLSSIPRDYVLAAEREPLWVLDDGRVALCLRRDVTMIGMLWMYDPRTQTCTHVANCMNIGIGVYTGNLLRQQVQLPENCFD